MSNYDNTLPSTSKVEGSNLSIRSDSTSSLRSNVSDDIIGKAPQVTDLQNQKVDSVKQIADVLHYIELQTGRFMILPAVALITDFLTTDQNIRKLPILHAIIQLYAPETTYKSVHKLMGVIPEITSLFAIVLKTFSSTQGESILVPSAEYVPDLDVVQHALNSVPTSSFEPSDPLTGIEGLLNANKGDSSIYSWLEQNMSIVRPILGIAAMMAACFGITKMIDFAFMKEGSKNLITFVNSMKAGDYIKKNVEEGIDSLLSMVYKAFGHEYFTPAAQKIKILTEKVDKLYLECYEYMNSLKVDFFGLIRSNTSEKLQLRFAAFNREFNEITMNDKSNYNVNHKLTKVMEILDKMNEMRIDILKADSGKQRPVAVWISGLAGHGKTEMMGKLSRDVTKTIKGHSYSRNVMDSYHSGYAGQAVCMIDDVDQRTDNIDHLEFHSFTSSDQKDVVGAALQDKGKPFTSRFLFVTSNTNYINTSSKIQDKKSFDRRRDYCIYVHNQHLVDYRKIHNCEPTDPNWWKNHQPRLILFNSIRADDPASPSVSIVNEDSPEYLCDITYEDLLEAVLEFEKFRAESYRQQVSIVLSNRGEDVPTVPITYDRTKFDHISIRDKNKKVPPVNVIEYDPACIKEVSIDKPVGDYTFVEIPSGNSGHVEFRGKKILGCLKDAISSLDYTFDTHFEDFLHKSDAPFSTYVVNDMFTDDCLVEFLQYNDAQDEVVIIRKVLGKFYVHSVGGSFLTNSVVIDQGLLRDYIKQDFSGEQIMTIFGKAKHFIMHVNAHWVGVRIDIPLKRHTILQPVEDKRVLKKYCVGLMGDSHVGKTFLVNEAFPDNELYKVAFLKDEVYPTDKVLWFDDVTAGRDRYDVFRSVLVEYYTSTNPNGNPIVFTGNNDTSIWREFKQEREMITNRAFIFYISPTFKVSLKLKLRGKTIGEYLQDKTYAERDKHLVVRCNRIKDNIVISNLAALIRAKTHIEDIVENQQFTKPFIVPMPDNFDYIVEIPMAFKEYDASDITPADFLKINCQRYQNGKFRSCTYLEMIGQARNAMSIINAARASFCRNIDLFISEFNQMKAKYDAFPHIIVRFVDYTLGFISCDGIVTGYVVDSDYPSKIRVTEGGVLVEGDFVKFRAGNERYLSVLKKLYSEKPNSEPANDQVSLTDLTMELFEEFPFTKYIKMVASVIGLGLTFTSIGLLVSSIFTKKKVSADQPINSVQVEFEDEYEDDVIIDGERQRRAPKGYMWVYDYETHTWYLVEITSRSHQREARYGSKIEPERQRRAPKGFVWVYDYETRTYILVPITSRHLYESINSKNVKIIEKVPKVETTEVIIPEGASNTMEIPKENKHEVIWDKLSEEKPIKGDVVFNNHGDFGIFMDNEVFYLSEGNLGTFTGTKVAFTDSWRPISMRDVNSFNLTDRQNLDHKFVKVNNLDSRGIIGIMGKTFVLSSKTKIDLSCVFAFCFSYGIPYDMENGMVWLVAIQKLFPIDGDVQIPYHLKNFYSLRFPNYLKDVQMDRKENKEGMVDPMCMNQANIVAKNVCALYDLDESYILNGIMIRGNEGITTAHAFDDSDELFMTIYRDERKYKIKKHSVNKVGDIATFRVIDKDFKAVKNIMSFVMTDSEFSQCMTARPVKFPVMIDKVDLFNDSCQMIIFSSASLQTTNTGSTRGAAINYRVDVGHVGYSGVTQPGDCGNPIFIVNKTVQAKLFSMHRAGASSVSIGVTFTREYLEQLFNGREKIASPERKERDEIMKHKISKICTRTNLNLVATPKYTIYTPDTTSKYRTGLRLTEEFEPSIMSTKDIRNNEHRSMLDEGLKRYSHKLGVSPQCIKDIDEAVYSIANDIVSIFDSKEVDLRLYTKSEALNTPFKDEFPKSNPVDRSGSPGYPFAQMYKNFPTKGHYLRQNPKNSLWYLDHIPEAQYVSSRIDQMCIDAELGISPESVFVAYLKDEVYPKAKIYDASKMKTRVFFACPFDFLISYRKYFGAFIHRLAETFELHPIKVGMNYNSLEGHCFYHYLTVVSDHGFDMDYANWDGTIPLEFTQAVPKLINAVYQSCSRNGEWKPEHDIARLALHQACEQPYVATGNRVYRFDHAQVSGNPGTAVENSLINWILTYCVWLRLARQHSPEQANYASFKKLVRCAFYGDDFIAMVHPSVQKWFHFNSCKEIVTQFGFVATDASKQTGSVPDIRHISDLEFLKKTFRSQNGYWVGKANLKSIMKQLEWIRYKPPYRVTSTDFPECPDVELITQSINTIFVELALHGEDFYNEWTSKIRNEVKGRDMILSIPSFRECYSGIGMPI